MIRQLGPPKPPDFVLMEDTPMEGAAQEGHAPVGAKEPSPEAIPRGQGQVVPLSQIVRASGLQGQYQAPPPMWEGFRVHVEHGMQSPLKDFLQDLVHQLGRQVELPPGLLDWITKQDRLVGEMGTGLQQIWRGISGHEKSLKEALPQIFKAVEDRLIETEKGLADAVGEIHRLRGQMAQMQAQNGELRGLIEKVRAAGDQAWDQMGTRLLIVERENSVLRTESGGAVHALREEVAQLRAAMQTQGSQLSLSCKMQKELEDAFGLLGSSRPAMLREDSQRVTEAVMAQVTERLKTEVEYSVRRFRTLEDIPWRNGMERQIAELLSQPAEPRDPEPPRAWEPRPARDLPPLEELPPRDEPPPARDPPRTYPDPDSSRRDRDKGKAVRSEAHRRMDEAVEMVARRKAAQGSGLPTGFGVHFPEEPIQPLDPLSDEGERKAARQHEMVRRLRAKGFNLTPPGYESESSNPRGPTIRMVRWGSGSEGSKGSLLLNLLAARSTPRFSGEENEWEAFAQEWSAYLDILREAEGGDIPDVFLFEVLRGCVDTSTHITVKAMRQKDPAITFTKVWQQLERLNTHDQAGARRREWARIALKNGDLNLATWRNYQSSFELAWARAEGISEREAEDKILHDLPFEWRERLTKECGRRAQDNFWVRIPKPVPFPVEDLLEILQAASGTLGLAMEVRQMEILVRCQNEAAQEAVLELDGWGAAEARLRVQWAARRLTVHEMCRWVERELRVEAELRPQSFRPRRVGSVSDESSGERGDSRPRKGKSKGKGRGRSETRQDGGQDGGGKSSPKGDSKGKGKGKGKSRSESRGPQPQFRQDRTPSPRKQDGGEKRYTREEWAEWDATCLVCKSARRPCKHPYWECKHWQEARRKKKEEAEKKAKGGNAPAGGKKGGADAPASSTPKAQTA